MKSLDSASIPCLCPGVRLRALDDGTSVLLVPEGVITLSATGGAVIESIDGRRDIAAIVASMAERFDAAGRDIEADVTDLLIEFAQRTWIEPVK
jgi:coenzyme PQQ biosynthesis protein PqqD